MLVVVRPQVDMYVDTSQMAIMLRTECFLLFSPAEAVDQLTVVLQRETTDYNRTQHTNAQGIRPAPPCLHTYMWCTVRTRCTLSTLDPLLLFAPIFILPDAEQVS